MADPAGPEYNPFVSRDLEIVKERIEGVRVWRAKLSTTMVAQGFDLLATADLVPIYAHRYVVCTSALNSSVVLSIQDGADAIVYGNSLQEYFEREFLS